MCLRLGDLLHGTCVLGMNPMVCLWWWLQLLLAVCNNILR